MLHLFTIHGRIKRLTFWEGLLAWFLLNVLLLMLQIALIATPLGARMAAQPLYEFMNKNLGDTEHVSFSWLVSSMLFVQWVIALWILAAICAKRWHDLNYSGWLALLNLVPVVALGAGSLAFLGGIERTMIYRLVADPHAGMFAIITSARQDYWRYYLAGSPWPVIAWVIVLGAFLYLGLGKGSKGANTYGKSAA